MNSKSLKHECTRKSIYTSDPWQDQSSQYIYERRQRCRSLQRLKRPNGQVLWGCIQYIRMLFRHYLMGGDRRMKISKSNRLIWLLWLTLKLHVFPKDMKRYELRAQQSPLDHWISWNRITHNLEKQFEIYSNLSLAGYTFVLSVNILHHETTFDGSSLFVSLLHQISRL